MSLALVVLGARGRLGGLVVAEAARRPGAFRVHAALGRGDDVGAACVALPRPGCVIDLTTAGSTALHARACAERAVPLVVATTGLGADDERALDEAARVIPVLQAANLSVSAHVAAHLAFEASRLLAAPRGDDAAAEGGFDVEVVEIHHRKKKDAPSGTALMLARAAAEGRGQDWAGPGTLRRSRDGHAPRVGGEIGVFGVRGGDVVGEHTVYFLGDGERIEIVHRVTDRGVFARGALDAAAFLAASGRGPGRYAMADVIAARGARDA